jgi:hypothetical protein
MDRGREESLPPCGRKHEVTESPIDPPLPPVFVIASCLFCLATSGAFGWLYAAVMHVERNRPLNGVSAARMLRRGGDHYTQKGCFPRCDAPPFKANFNQDPGFGPTRTYKSSPIETRLTRTPRSSPHWLSQMVTPALRERPTCKQPRSIHLAFL